MKTFSILFIALSILISLINSPFANGVRKEALNESPVKEKENQVSIAGLIIIKGIEFFKNTISRVDGDRCPSYPTCSEYGEMVVKKHGPILGILMIVDRLIHETSEGKFAPWVEIQGIRRIYDPPENNDFWFTR
jgi:putative component of membrane protein insertase Oxa1/YidC/SpoIIIJ protein YidD